MKAFHQKYTKQKVIGQGAFGEAWLVMEKDTKKKLVMKKLYSRGMTEEEKKMAQNEIDVLKKCVHENIVRYIDDFYEKGEIFFVMEFYQGGDLAGAIEKQSKIGEPFSVDRVENWTGQLTAGLIFMKDNKIIHRDLKPANIFLNSFNILKIGDYGLAKSLSRTTQLAATQCGTLIYMAPELLDGKEYSHGADVWAMGCIFYEMITLKQSFTSLRNILMAKFKPIPPGLHPSTSVLVSQILVVDPSKRPTADQIGDIVGYISSQLGNIQVSPPTPQGFQPLEQVERINKQQQRAHLQLQAGRMISRCNINHKNQQFKDQIKSKWGTPGHSVSMEELQAASELVQARMLSSVGGMQLKNINLRVEDVMKMTLPTFSGEVSLHFLSGELSMLLSLITCNLLGIYHTNLTKQDTESLVLRLKSNVSKLVLGGGVVDISVLCQYTGKGKCKYVKCMCDSYDKYNSQVTEWAKNIGWKVKDCGGVLEVFKA